MTFAGIALVLIGGDPVQAASRELLGLRLEALRNHAPTIGHVLVLAAHNLPLTAWPLLLGGTGAHRHRRTRLAADILVAVLLAINTLPVGVALGAYGSAVLAYLPQVPLEWVAFATGATGWLLQRRHTLTASKGMLLFGVCASVVICAAILETVAVPHR